MVGMPEKILLLGKIEKAGVNGIVPDVVMTEEVHIYCCRYCRIIHRRRSNCSNQICRKKKVVHDRDKKVEWDGPLVIMVNSFQPGFRNIGCGDSRL
jgi:hypothetical protein